MNPSNKGVSFEMTEVILVTITSDHESPLSTSPTLTSVRDRAISHGRSLPTTMSGPGSIGRTPEDAPSLRRRLRILIVRSHCDPNGRPRCGDKEPGLVALTGNASANLIADRPLSQRPPFAFHSVATAASSLPVAGLRRSTHRSGDGGALNRGRHSQALHAAYGLFNFSG